MNTLPVSEPKSEPEIKWWVAKAGEHQGPYSSSKIISRIHTGKLKPETLICAVGADAWMAAEETPEFKVEFSNVLQQDSNKVGETVAAIANSALAIKLPKIAKISAESLKSVFRYLLVGEIVFGVLSLFLMVFGEVVFEGIYPPIEQSNLFAMIVLIAFAITAVVFLPATVIAWIGLFSFKNWARWLYLGLFVFGYVLWLPSAVFDYSPSWGLSVLASDTATLCTGAILALVFFSPLSSCFNKTPVDADD